MVISLLFLLIISFIDISQYLFLRKYLFLSLLIIATIPALIYWWQRQLTKYYKRNLELRELESLRAENAELIKENKKLKEQNQEYGRLIHKDNKLLSALEQAVYNVLTNDVTTQEKEALLSEIQKYSHGRSQTLHEIADIQQMARATGILSIDNLLKYMISHAREFDATLTSNITVELTKYLPDQMAIEDATHMLSDLLENAIYACSKAEQRKILLQVYTFRNHLCFEISDTGIPFEIHTLANLGLKEASSHTNDGGSGIGLMDIWKIKNNYGASLHISEFGPESPFTKRISVIMDKKNQYILSSPRNQEIATQINRVDINIIP